MHKIDQELYFVIDEKNNSVDMTEKGIDLITLQVKIQVSLSFQMSAIKLQTLKK